MRNIILSCGLTVVLCCSSSAPALAGGGQQKTSLSGKKGEGKKGQGNGGGTLVNGRKGTSSSSSAGRSRAGRSRAAPDTAGVAAPGAVRPGSQGEISYGEAIHYKNLSVVPVLTSRQGPFQKYTLLEAGLEAKTLKVRELRGSSDDAQVSAVQVKNKGQYPVYLLGGEMILGGKQDRIIQSDTVVPNTGKWIKVSVFCVEQGRWQGQKMKFSSGKALAHATLRRAAMSGSQSKVWAAVAAKNRMHRSQSSTDTYRRTIQNKKVRAKIAPYRDKLTTMLPTDKTLAGLVFAINGKIRVADIFGNPVLFGDLSQKLLTAYILEALGHQVQRNAPKMGKGQAQKFIGKARALKRMKMKKSGRAANYKMEDKDQVGAETIDTGTGKKVRESYIAK